MSWSSKARRPSPAQARAFWSEELTDAAKAAGKVRIACSPEDHTAIRNEAARIAHAEGRDVVFDITMPRMVSVAFSRRAPRS